MQSRNNSADHINNLVLRVAEGDVDAFPLLLSLYEPLISSSVSSFSYLGEYDDLRQEALTSFFLAAVSFDPNNGVSFGAYAKMCIRNRFVSLARKNKLMTSQENSDEIISKEEVTEGKGRDPLLLLLEEESCIQIEEYISHNLSDYENRVIRYHLSGNSVKEIASKVGRDPSSVQNALFRIRDKLKGLL